MRLEMNEDDAGEARAGGTVVPKLRGLEIIF